MTARDERRARAQAAAARLRAKFDDIPGQLQLIRLCESHGNGAPATHRVDFLTAPPFYVCASCADDARDRGITVTALGGEE